MFDDIIQKIIIKKNINIVIMQVIAERKFYHECTNGQHLKSFENDGETEVDNDAKIIGNVTQFDIIA